MAQPATNPRTVRFGLFELDLDARELRKSGVRIKLQEQPFQILAMLLERPGAIVTREAMQKNLWPGDTFVDFDLSLNSAVKKLRQALSDDSENPRFVETLYRRGYRFIAPVNGHSDSGQIQPMENGSAPAPPPPIAAARPSIWRRRLVYMGIPIVVVTVAIVGVLAGAAMPLVRLTAQRERETELHQSLRILRNAIDAYKQAADTGRIRKELGDSGYPPNLQTLVDGVEDIQSEKKVSIYFLRRVPRDPLFPDPSVAPADTWGLRSYKSSASDPQAGDDVYDVYSMAQGRGLNGIAYRDW